MNVEALFSAANASALLGWLALLLAPLRRSAAVAAARWVAALLAGLYTVLIAAALLAGAGEAPDFGSAAALAQAFSRPEVLLVGWVHYLAFDLWTGAWIVEDAPRARLPHWAVVPILVLTFLAGPVGLIIYLLARSTRRTTV